MLSLLQQGCWDKPEQPQDGEQEPIFTDEGMEEAVAAAKRASRPSL